MTRDRDHLLAGGLVVLAVVLAVNSVFGPLVLGAVTYPFSESVLYQTIGLEAVSLLVVAPWSLVAGVLVWRSHPVGPVLGIPPAAYTSYMFLQYVVGPQYLEYTPVVAAHLLIFVVSWLVLVRAWAGFDESVLPALSAHRRTGYVVLLAVLALFTVSRYVAAVQGMVTGAPIAAEYATDPTMYWSIVFLDMGIVVPATLVTALGLTKGATWARKATYGVVGWFVLVPISVAAMSVVMLVNGDPNASVAQVAVLGIAALVFTGFAAWVYRPLVERR
ncbi:MAG: hypothetical protein ABEJ67_02455 [Halanaeroarchaeum sp.]